MIGFNILGYELVYISLFRVIEKDIVWANWHTAQNDEKSKRFGCTCFFVNDKNLREALFWERIPQVNR